MTLTDQHRENRLIMKNNLAAMKKEGEKNSQKRRKKVCMKCKYYTKKGVPFFYCSYLEVEGHMRPCHGSECVEKHVFKSKKESK